jgi:hypothetical protein
MIAEAGHKGDMAPNAFCGGCFSAILALSVLMIGSP